MGWDFQFFFQSKTRQTVYLPNLAIHLRSPACVIPFNLINSFSKVRITYYLIHLGTKVVS